MDWENQKMLETLFNKKQTKKLLRREFSGDLELMDHIELSKIDQEFAIDLLSVMAMHKRATLPMLVGLLKHHFFDKTNAQQMTAAALEVATEADLVDYDMEAQQFILKWDVDQDTHDLIRQYQYLPPMIIPPLEVTSNRGSGYLTKRDDSLLLKNNHHEGDICLDSINRFNRIPLSVNVNVVRMIRNHWKGIDKPKDGETFDDYKQRLKAFERYERDSFQTIAFMVEMGNRFHLTHKDDKRGRTYCQGYHLTYQGNDWNKACIQLAEPEYVL